MTKHDPWEWTQVTGNYAQIKLASWSDFAIFMDEMLEYNSYIWRGQRCEGWMLESPLDRLTRKLDFTISEAHDFTKNHLARFQYAARGRRGVNPPEIKTENDWWALGQHHGLITPLLDWTSSPFVAAYFAFVGQDQDQSKYRSVYAVQSEIAEDRVQEIVKESRERNQKELAEIEAGKKPGGLLSRVGLGIDVQPEIEFVRPLSDENQRLVNQGGLFTRMSPGKTIDSWASENVKDQGAVVMEILIPDDNRLDCLTTLNRMNINHLTLFPDLYGASKFCNISGEIPNY